MVIQINNTQLEAINATTINNRKINYNAIELAFEKNDNTLSATFDTLALDNSFEIVIYGENDTIIYSDTFNEMEQLTVSYNMVEQVWHYSVIFKK